MEKRAESSLAQPFFIFMSFILRDTGWASVDGMVGATVEDVQPVDVNSSDHIGDGDTHSYNFPRKTPGECWHHNSYRLTHRL